MAKLSQAGLIDKHLEKILLGIAALVLVVVLVRWVASSPLTGRISSEEPVPIVKIDQELKDLASRTANYIDGRTAQTQDVPQWVSTLDSRMQQPFAPLSQNLLNLTEGSQPLKLKKKASDRRLAVLPTVPALSAAIVRAQPELVKMSSSGQPAAKDITTAHVTAVLDYGTLVKTWREALRDVGLPVEILFLEVTADRQELLPDGSWGPSVEVTGVQDTTFGGGGYLATSSVVAVPAFPAGQSVEENRNLINAFRASGVQEQVIEPEYYHVYWINSEWGTWRFLLPSTPVNRLDSAIIPPEHQAPALASDTAAPAVTPAAHGPAHASPAGGPRGGGPATGGPPPGFGGPPPGFGGPPPGFGGPPAAAARPAARPGASTPAAAAGPVAPVPMPVIRPSDMPKVTPVPSLANQCKAGLVQVWLHDTSLEPGKTYRYRLKVALLNPAYGEYSLVDQKDLASSLTVTGVSGWSTPVEVPPTTEFYVASGSADSGKIVVDVFRRAYGLVLRQSFPISRGGRIGEVKTRKYKDPISNTVQEGAVDFSTDCVLVDFNPGPGGSGTELTILAPSGRLVVRTDTEDAKDKRHQKLVADSRLADRILQASQ